MKLAFLGLLLVCASIMALADAFPAKIQDINVVRNHGEVEVKVALTAPVQPQVRLASNPPRLVIDFPNTTAAAGQTQIPVNENGVSDVRIGLNRTAPPVARVVIDLEASRPFGLKVEGTEVALTVLPAQKDPFPAPPDQGLDDPRSSLPVAMESAATHAPVPPPRPKPAAGVTRTSFAVKYVAQGVAYLDGGSNSGLAPGMQLDVSDSDLSYSGGVAAPRSQGVVTELRIVAVAANSAVAATRVVRRDVKEGDRAYLSAADTEGITARRLLLRPEKHTASLASPWVRKSVPIESAPDRGRIRARIGLDYSGIRSRGSTPGTSSALGVLFQSDITNILGTHWNLQGYWHGRLTRNSQPNEETIQDFLNKTFTMQLYYDNPESKWVAGFGRLYLPWAVSLDTIDGGYVGRRVSKGMLAGIFAGSTPDPTSWHYAPDRRMAGAFINFEGGNYDSFHYSSTSGAALNSVDWRLDRPYMFFEHELSYKQGLSLYHSFIVDYPTGNTTNGVTPGPGVSRSYLTLHIVPHRRISFDIYHNYFRDVPTASTQFIGTGLVDHLLYQGLSAGVRVQAVRHVFVYTTLGQSTKTGDAKSTLNQMYGITWDGVGHTGIRADLRYSKFASPFADGNYLAFTMSRHLGDHMFWDTRIGRQLLTSSVTRNDQSEFVNSSLDMNLGSHSFLQSGYTFVKGSTLDYTQWYVSLGYRFDTAPGSTR